MLTNNKVTTEHSKKDFYRIIKPITLWMKIIGVNLNSDGLRRQSILAVLYTLLWLTVDIYLFVATIYASSQDSIRLPTETESPMNFTSTISWIAVVIDANYNSKLKTVIFEMYILKWVLVVSVLGIHCALLIKTSSIWPSLLENLRFQSSELPISTLSSKEILKFTILITFYAVVFVSYMLKLLYLKKKLTIN
jgi:hypothetical protein